MCRAPRPTTTRTTAVRVYLRLRHMCAEIHIQLRKP